MFLNCSTCFGRHTAHHQELKNCSHRSGNRQPKTYVKPEVVITVFELLMMGCVSPETCWAIKKHWNNKLYYTVASCWFFLWDLYYDARIDKHQELLCIWLYRFNLHWFVVHRVPYITFQVKGKAFYVEALSVPGVWGSQISRQSAHESGKFVSLLYHQEIFLLEAEPTT